MMNKLNKKWIIGISIVAVLLALVIVIGIVIRINSKSIHRNENNAKETIVNEYSAYVSINPLIKLSFKVSCQNNNCAEPIITDTELVNEDAKEIYKDLVLENKTLKESIGILTDTVKENNIAFKEVHIYTNYDNEQEFRVDSIDYEIVLDVMEEKDLEKVIDELIIEPKNKKTREIIIPISYSKTTSDNGLAVLEVNPLEHEDLFIATESKYSETDRHTRNFQYVKVIVSGPEEIIDTLSEQYIVNEEFNKNPSIYGLLDSSNLGVGSHTLKLNFNTSIQDIEVLTPPIECQIKIVTFEDWRWQQPIPLD